MFAKFPSRDQSRYGGDDARSQAGRLSTLHSLGTGVGVGGSARARLMAGGLSDGR
jgi:hypothetical protein